MNDLKTRNLLALTAYRYSGSPWFLWMMAITGTVVPLEIFLITQPVFPWTRWFGVVLAIFAVWYWSTLVYYYTHREAFAANPAPPIAFGKRELLWTIGITLTLVVIFGALILTVWRN